MKVALLINPRSGRGRARRLGHEAARALRDAGHEAVVSEVGSLATDRECAARVLEACDLAVAVGGDGTVNHLLDALAISGTPVYHLPTGNENLLAREFGMTASVARMLAAVQTFRIERIDLARCNGRPFALMASIGPDAGVIHRLDRSRTRTTGHSAYIFPVLAELRRPCLPSLTVVVDGRTLVERSRGLVVIANSRHYGLRIDPCARASVTDGLLDVAFLPAKNATAAVAWLLAARCRSHRRFGAPAARGAGVQAISEEGEALCQVDGETGPPGQRGREEAGATWECTVERGALRILMPPAGC